MRKTCRNCEHGNYILSVHWYGKTRCHVLGAFVSNFKNRKDCINWKERIKWE